MLKKLKEKAEARREADMQALAGLKERARKMVSPEMAGLVAAAIAQRAADQGLVCDLTIELGMATPVAEATIATSLAPGSLTPEMAAELQARKPPPPPGLEPIVAKLEGAAETLLGDLGERLAAMKEGLAFFSEVEVSASIQIDAQVFSVWMTITASQSAE